MINLVSILVISPIAAFVLFIFVIRDSIHLIQEGRKGLVKNVPRILLGGFFTGCVGAAILVGVFSRYYRFFLSGSSGDGTGCTPGLQAFTITLITAALGIIGFCVGFLLGAGYLRRKFKRK